MHYQYLWLLSLACKMTDHSQTLRTQPMLTQHGWQSRYAYATQSCENIIAYLETDPNICVISYQILGCVGGTGGMQFLIFCL